MASKQHSQAIRQHQKQAMLDSGSSCVAVCARGSLLRAEGAVDSKFKELNEDGSGSKSKDTERKDQDSPILTSRAIAKAAEQRRHGGSGGG